ncbi:MAG: DNA-formamidopyrimidine glycosylase family protein [Myxococcota bacterium]
MPELPDIEAYLVALRERVVGRRLAAMRLRSPFLLRTVTPPAAAFTGRTLQDVSRLGKRIVFAFGAEHFAVVHLMVAGRFQWKPLKGDAFAAVPGRNGLAAFDFEAAGSLLLTEASKKKRARLHLVEGATNLAEHNPGGVEALGMTEANFIARLRARNHTLKRALTDPRIFSGIGNAYSDEILFDARLPPTRWTSRLSDDDLSRLYASTQRVLTEWSDRLIDEAKARWPKKVTAFRPEMNVHGRYGKPCNVCGAPIQRIRFADNETNYCATCQNGGKLLADRGLSRLLKGDWPKTLEQLEQMKEARKNG